MAADVTITTLPCIECGKTSKLIITAEEYSRYDNGEYVQDVFPNWSKEDRELLITGTHPECWKKIFIDQGEEN